MSPAISVTVTFTATLAEVGELLQKLEGKATNVSAAPAAAGETPPKTRKPRTSAAAETPAPAEVVDDDLFGDDKPATAAGKVWTLDEVKEQVNQFIQKNSTSAVKAIMADQFKAKKLVDIDAKRYAEFVAVLNK